MLLGNACALQECQRLVVAAALQIVTQLRMHRLGQLRLQLEYAFRHRFERIEMPSWIPRVKSPIRNQFEPVSESSRQRSGICWHGSGEEERGATLFRCQFPLCLVPVVRFGSWKPGKPTTLGDEVSAGCNVLPSESRRYGSGF